MNASASSPKLSLASSPSSDEEVYPLMVTDGFVERDLSSPWPQQTRRSAMSMKRVLVLLTIASIVFFGASLVTLYKAHSLFKSAGVRTKKSRPLYGHIHIAKTAGTTLNGILAMRYERVCGHKGYSYDAYQANERKKALNATDERYNGDSISMFKENYNRGRVPLTMMQEIGFEDCDWVSFEFGWVAWRQFQNWTIPLSLELHVPCRDPLDHLMSQCNHLQKQFDCKAEDLEKEIELCLLQVNRFSNQLLDFKNTQVRCFDALSLDQYISYMDDRLDKKRIPAEYSFRPTNKERDKDKECIWKNHGLQERVQSILLQKYDYYQFCNNCIGSKNNLLL